jgi:hypothetical protein
VLNVRNNETRSIRKKILPWAGILQSALLISSPCNAQSKALQPAKLDRLCGKFEKTQAIPEKANPSFIHTKSKNLSASELKLFFRTSDAPCCSAVPVARVKTNHWGNFNFKNVAAGSYWLLATVDSKEVRMPLEFKPDKRSTAVCSEQFFYVDESYNFGIAETITVD